MFPVGYRFLPFWYSVTVRRYTLITLVIDHAALLEAYLNVHELNLYIGLYDIRVTFMNCHTTEPGSEEGAIGAE